MTRDRLHSMFLRSAWGSAWLNGGRTGVRGLTAGVTGFRRPGAAEGQGTSGQGSGPSSARVVLV